MSAFLTALTSVASQYGEAKDQARQEKEALAQRQFENAQKLRGMDLQDARLQLEKQSQQRMQQQLDYEIKRGRYQDLGLPMYSQGGKRYKPFYDVQEGKVSPVELPGASTDAVSLLKQQMGGLSEDQQKMVQGKYESTLQSTGGDEGKALDKAQDLVDRLAERNQATTEKQREYDERRKDRLHDDEMRRQERISDRKLLMDYAKNLSSLKPTADEVRRADLAENVGENLDALEEIVKRRPELFGPPLHGTLTTLRGKIGTSDEDIAALEQIRDNLGRALQGAHGMRSATGVLSAGNSVLNSFRNNDKAVLSAIKRARASVQTFISDVQRKAGSGAVPSDDPNNPLKLWTP